MTFEPRHLDIHIPETPPSWKPPALPVKPVVAVKPAKLLPAGAAYLAHARREIHNLSHDESHAIGVAEQNRRSGGNKVEIEDDLGVGDEEESDELLALDPKEWKQQDHYAVLGLSHLRYKATPAQIKVANRKKVLKHHPDKKASGTGAGVISSATNTLSAAMGINTNDDAFFKCIAKANEVLTNPERRRQFDSVDPWYQQLDEDEPLNVSDFKLSKDATDEQRAKMDAKFFEKYGAFFERESRFSKKQPVPMLGSIDAPKNEVEQFYDVWYNFDSWRSFEYLDKEVNEGSDSRDDKRYTEKKNKSERARRKKEDTARLRQVVDDALSIDPRIKRIKAEEKAAREAKKNVKSPSSSKAKAEEEKRLQEEEAKKKAEEEALAKAEAKKAKAAAANAAKKARRAQKAEAEAAAS